MADAINIIIGLVIFFFIIKLIFGRSENGNEANRTGGRRHYVNPNDVNAIASMFPQIPRSAIENDLALTGNVNLTCEKILRGDIVIPHEAPERSSFTNSGSTSTNTKVNSQFKDIDINQPIQEPEKIWKKTSEERQLDFSKRKLYIYQQARKRYMEKQKENEGGNENSAENVEEKKTL